MDDFYNTSLHFPLWLVLPSLACLLIKLWLTVKAQNNNLLLSNFPLTYFLIGVVGINLVELVTYLGITSQYDILIKLFYLFATIAISGIFIFSIESTNLFTDKIRRYMLGYYAVTFILCVMVVSSNSIVNGYEYIEYSITRSKGEAYWLWQVFTLGSLLPTIFILMSGYRNGQDYLTKTRCKLIMLSVSPSVVLAIVLVLLMEFGLKINSSILFPISTSFMLLFFVYAQNKYDLYRLLILIPTTKERLMHKKISEIVIHYMAQTGAQEPLKLKLPLKNIEKELIELALELHSGHQAKTAEMLGLSKSSLSRKVRYE